MSVASSAPLIAERGEAVSLQGDTPVQRHLSLLELIATRDAPSTLQGLTDETGLPKATLHRMLVQLEESGMIRRDGDGRTFYTGTRLRRIAERTLMTDGLHGARHRVLANLADELGESCNITALSGDEVIYLDRVETEEPLRVTFAAGSRVPAHASASGKLLLGQLRASRRRNLLAAAPLRRFTRNTLTDVDLVEDAVRIAAQNGFAIDNEEYVQGLVCAAVPVPSATTSTLCVAVQAPRLRLSPDDCERLVPSLQRAAQAIAVAEGE